MYIETQNTVLCNFIMLGKEIPIRGVSEGPYCTGERGSDKPEKDPLHRRNFAIILSIA